MEAPAPAASGPHASGRRAGGAFERHRLAEGVLYRAVQRELEGFLARSRACQRPVLVIDGSKALRKAVRDVFGGLALLHRCQIPKERNVLEHLPQALRPSVRRAAEPALAAYIGSTDGSHANYLFSKLRRRP